jgi:hypothetical protein
MLCVRDHPIVALLRIWLNDDGTVANRVDPAKKIKLVRDTPTFLPLPSAIVTDLGCAKWQEEIGNMPAQGDTYSASEFDGLMVTVYNPLYYTRAGFQPEFVVQRDPMPRPEDITLREAVHHYGEDTVNDVLKTHYVDTEQKFRENDLSDVEFLWDGNESNCDLEQDSDDTDSGNWKTDLAFVLY